jgi:hypothetical protein
MKAVRFHEFGGTSVLRYEEAPTPQPGPGEVLVKVAATAFNPLDRWLRVGAMEEVLPVHLPHTLGLDVAGTVVDHGPGVEDPAIGTEVIGFLPMTGTGAGAEFVAAPAEVLVRAPANIALPDAAAIPVPALTAWQALFEHGHLVAGQRVLVNGAGGGVGGFVVQLAKWAGAEVIATASPRSADAVRAAGADHIIDYTSATRRRTTRASRSCDQSGRRYPRGHRRPARRHRAWRNTGVRDPTRWRVSRTPPTNRVLQRAQRHDSARPNRRPHPQRIAPARHQRATSPGRHGGGTPTKRGRHTAGSHPAHSMTTRQRPRIGRTGTLMSQKAGARRTAAVAARRRLQRTAEVAQMQALRTRSDPVDTAVKTCLTRDHVSSL